MKKYLSIGAALLLAAVSAQSQTTTNQPPATPQAFYTSVLDYFSSNDTNQMFTPFKLWTSGDYLNGVNFADSIDFSYDLLKPKTYAGGVSVGLEAGMRNAGIAGTIVDGGAGVELAYNLYSIRVEGYADAEYNVPFHRTIGELGARVLKKATPNTFFGLSMGFEIPTASGPTYPVVGVLAGCTF